MKKEDFLPYEQSVHLKLMGFDEPCITSYDQEGLLRNPFDYANSEWAYAGSHQQYFSQAEHMVSNSELKSGFTAAPTWSQVLRWLDGNINQLQADILTKLEQKLQQQ
jgi:hypothetical protein